CKDCTQKIFEYYYESSNDFQKATYYTCQKLDIPFKIDLFEYVLKQKRSNQDFLNLSKNYMGKYIGELNKATTKYGTCLDFSYSDTGLSEIDTKIEQRDKIEKELESLQVVWGIQDTAEDYIFLQDRFKEYTQGVEFINAYQPDLYRDLCRDRLILRKILEGRYDGSEDLTKVQNRVSKNAKDLKLDNFEDNKPKTISQKALFEKIKLVDENNVKDFYKEPTVKYDLNKLMKYEKDMVYRPLGKTLVGHRDFDIKQEDLDAYEVE
ncbi:MAG: hypothetical protein BV457_08015, partial [Thermoplasmata archaeon M9B1D]